MKIALALAAAMIASALVSCADRTPPPPPPAMDSGYRSGK